MDRLTELKMRKLQLLQEKHKSQCEESLSKYTKKAWEVIEPGIDYIHNWHIDCIAEHLQAVNLGQINRLLINMPPRHMKSIAVTVMWPTWTWTKDPYKRFISLSYSASLSKKHNMNRRDIITSPWYQSNWKDKFKLKEDQNTQIKFENDKTGFMFSTSIDGTLTGEGGDYIIVDDPHNPQQAESEAERTKAIEFFKSTLPSRLNNKKKGAFIIVMQRLHEEDVSGHVLAEGGYTHLCLPAISEGKQTIIYPISGFKKEREDKELLWPEREGQKEIDDMKRSLGSYGFAGQYQQTPAPKGGGKIKEHWFRYWKPKGMELPPVTVTLPDDGGFENIYAVDLPDYFDEQIQSWDCAFKDGKDNDCVAGGVVGRRLANYFLLDLVNEQMDITKTMSAIKAMSTKWPKALLKLIEDKANGSAVIQMLRTNIPGILPIEPEGGKLARVAAVSPSIESGNVYIPHPMVFTWVNDFIRQCTSFPNGAHDDMVDMMSQALNRLIYNSDDTKPGEQSPINFEAEREKPSAFSFGEIDESYINFWG